MRGLKQTEKEHQEKDKVVAPYVGAWIETHTIITHTIPEYVAPYVGAWIETKSPNLSILPLLVAPYVGAWIETSIGYCTLWY